MSIKNIVILGSTGSIGINTLKVIDRYPKLFRVVGLTAYNNFKLLEKQIKKYQPTHIASSEKGIAHLKQNINTRKTKILSVDRDLSYLVSLKSVDVVVIGMRGSSALEPFLSAAKAGKTIAPANKEALVIAGELIMKVARRHKSRIIPVDSEQSAIFQCLEGQNRKKLKCVHLTASGGALLNTPQSKFDKLTVRQILNHPRWKMGDKITVDSATLMNKGFEVIEAQRLFNLDIKQIKVVVHPQAIIHSMVEYLDGSILAQLAVTDMRLPIQYALTYPKRLSTGLPSLNFAQLGTFTFQEPNLKKFPALELSFYVAKKGGSLPSVLNAADEEAVEAFLTGRLKFTNIYKVVEKVVREHKIVKNPTLKNILEADQWAREQARKVIDN